MTDYLPQFIEFATQLDLQKLIVIQTPVTIISAFQLLKYRGEPFSSFGGGMDWPGRSVYGAGSGIGGYQSLGDPIDDERDAEEVNIPRHHSLHRFGRNRSSQQSDSFVTSSSRSTSVKSSGTGSGYNVEMGTNNSNSGAGGHQMQHQHQHQHQQHHGGSPASAGGTAVSLGSATAKDDRRDRVGQNVSDDESEDTSSREAPGNPATESRAGYQAF
ncbi:hypothetical protein BGZ65_002124 [Modicella reniformis]|uniref:Uncharacterized protein n=1 Tax=Modicella reniformis TaxID=1440133 RepID=A0A9P6MIL9_9FUNG|nr:hypothetical protein BGZ65_002124 [Modicella reniformis]